MKTINKQLPGLFFTAMLAGISTNAFSQACDAGTFNMPNVSVFGCTGYLNDSGGPSLNYSNNENKTFNIVPTGATSVSISFSAFSLENGFDKLKVCDNINGTGSCFTYTGTTIPSTITSTTGKMSLIFTSDAAVTSSGFRAIWTSTGGSCGGTFNMPNFSAINGRGTLYDSGGPTGNYGNNESKTFNIVPSGNTFVCLKFSQFNVASSDFVKVYNDINGTGTLLGSFTGTTIPSQIQTINGSTKMSVKFTSNSSGTSSGFKAIWSSDADDAFVAETEARILGADNAQLNNTSAFSGVRVFPNPADSKITIGFNVEQEGQAKVAVYNIAGMETIVLNELLSSGDHMIDFDASQLAKGVYFCKVITGNKVQVERFVKN